MIEHKELAKVIIIKVPHLLKTVQAIIEGKEAICAELAMIIASICHGLVELKFGRSTEEVHLLVWLNKILVHEPTVRTTALKTLELMSDTDSEDLLAILAADHMIEVLLGFVGSLAEHGRDFL